MRASRWIYDVKVRFMMAIMNTFGALIMQHAWVISQAKVLSKRE